MANRVVIVGRPNVGKSTLFNRLIGRRYAIVEDEPGITRDKIEGYSEWKGKEFVVVDTGGLVPSSREELLEQIKKFVIKELPEADIILFVVDGKEGLNPLDEEVAKFLYPYKDKVLVVVNKVDNTKVERIVGEFYALGFEKVFPISALHGRGVGELLDEVVKYLKEEKVEKPEEGIKVAFIGRPNVGKSSLINAILNDERVIVSPIAGTTRDAIEIPFSWKDKSFTLIDTAGIRRPSNVEYGVEFFSVGRSLKAIDLADIICLVVDASEGPTRQDKRLGGLIERRYKGCVIVANKMDLSPWTKEELESVIRKELFFLDFAPIVFTVAIKGEGIKELFESIEKVWGDYTRQHKTSYINRAIHKISQKPPPRYKGKETKVFYAFQEGIKPPTIVVITNYPDAWKENYKRFFVKELREHLNIKHAPLRLIIRGREESS